MTTETTSSSSVDTASSQPESNPATETNEATNQPAAQPAKLPFFPITLFGAILGFSGLTIAYNNASQIVGISEYFGLTLTVLTTLFFVFLMAVYLVKILKFPKAVHNELNHPVALNFFPAISLSLILLSIIYHDIAPTIAPYLFYLGGALQFVLTLYIMNSWLLHQKWQITQMNPAWFIPVVGNIVAPLGAVLYVNVEIAWFFFSIGLVFWLVLQAIVMYRLFFHPPMMQILEPTLFILIAPPAMGFLSYMALTDYAAVDDFARILFYTALFFTFMLATQVPRFIKVPFAVSWWAYTFPLSAITNASFIMYQELGYQVFAFLAAFFLAVLSALILHLTMKTLLAAKRGKICVPPPQPPQPQTPASD